MNVKISAFLLCLCLIFNAGANAAENSPVTPGRSSLPHSLRDAVLKHKRRLLVLCTELQRMGSIETPKSI
jgi:hypothetical protein